MCEAGICLPSMRVRAVAADLAGLAGSRAGEADEPRQEADLAAEMAGMLLGCGS
jgi:hypothetical protein